MNRINLVISLSRQRKEILRLRKENKELKRVLEVLLNQQVLKDIKISLQQIKEGKYTTLKTLK